ncbi:hypothetical protein [Bacillus timonensis]|uniref:hypothetical protein n=1 Tax=Bacillus timonensis TaxID=1033734 RepID=UPI0002DE50A7|nr:hypothetical protein [Bacillus timonensis]
MKQPIHETKLKEVESVKKPKKSIQQILSHLQSQGVNATLCKKSSKLILGS